MGNHSNRRDDRGGGDQRWDRYKADDRGSSGETNKIWLGGLPNDITERELDQLCAKYGSVQEIAVKHSHVDTFAFVTYVQPRHARDAIDGLDQYDGFGTGAIKAAPAYHKKGKGEGKGKDKDRGGDKGGDYGRYDRRDSWGDDRRGGWRDDARGGWRDHQRGDEPDDRGKGRFNDRGRAAYGGRSRSRSGRRSQSQDPPKPRTPRPVRVYLSQLPRDMEADELQAITAEYGTVLAHELHREGVYKCGWVEYATKPEGEACVAELNDRRMDDWSMRLQAYMYPGGGA